MKPFSLEEYLKNPNRKILTRDGRNVKIICTNFLSNKNVIAEIEKDVVASHLVEQSIFPS